MSWPAWLKKKWSKNQWRSFPFRPTEPPHHSPSKFLHFFDTNSPSTGWSIFFYARSAFNAIIRDFNRRCTRRGYATDWGVCFFVASPLCPAPDPGVTPLAACLRLLLHWFFSRCFLFPTFARADFCMNFCSRLLAPATAPCPVPHAARLCTFWAIWIVALFMHRPVAFFGTIPPLFHLPPWCCCHRWSVKMQCGKNKFGARSPGNKCAPVCVCVYGRHHSRLAFWPMSRCIFVAHATAVNLCLCGCILVHCCGNWPKPNWPQICGLPHGFFKLIFIATLPRLGDMWKELYGRGGMHKDARTCDEQLTGFYKLFIVGD